MPIPAAGYSATRLAVWQADLRSSFRTALDLVTAGLGATVNLDAGSVLGSIFDALAARLRDELHGAERAGVMSRANRQRPCRVRRLDPVHRVAAPKHLGV